MQTTGLLRRLFVYERTRVTRLSVATYIEYVTLGKGACVKPTHVRRSHIRMLFFSGGNLWEPIEPGFNSCHSPTWLSRELGSLGGVVCAHEGDARQGPQVADVPARPPAVGGPGLAQRPSSPLNRVSPTTDSSAR